jgi:hypothetical protein
MLNTPRVLHEAPRLYVTTLSRSLQRLTNGYADIGVKDDGASSCEAFILLVMDGDVQGVTAYFDNPDLLDDVLSVTSDGFDCVMLAVLLGDVQLLHAILSRINDAHTTVSRDFPQVAKLFKEAIEGADINMRLLPPLLRLPLRSNIAGQSALHLAVIWQDAGCLQLLLRYAPSALIQPRHHVTSFPKIQATRMVGEYFAARLHGAQRVAVCRHEFERAAVC